MTIKDLVNRTWYFNSGCFLEDNFVEQQLVKRH